jgi:flagellar protein FlgJ
MSESTPGATGTYLDFSALTRLRGQAVQDPKKTLRAAAEQFEAYFIQETLKAMRKTVEKSDLLDSQHADMYQDLFDKEVSVQMARRGGVGLANMLEREMARRESGQLPSTQQALALHPQQPALPLKAEQAGLPLRREAATSYPITPPPEAKP